MKSSSTKSPESDLIESLAKLEKVVPTGSFMSLHRGFFCPSKNPFRTSFPEGLQWPVIESPIDTDHLPKDDPVFLLIKEMERNAWLFGIDGNLSLLDNLWSHLSPNARGQALAGASERFQMEWAIEKWEQDDPIVFDASSATQICCDLIIDRRLERSTFQKMLSSVLDTAMDWGEQMVERLDDLNGERETRWHDHMDSLSQRAIDRCLEAAVREADAESARFCLAAGADPDIGIWCLERSSNSQYCALSYAIAKTDEASLVQALLDAGADPAGTEYDGRNKPLYLALDSKLYNLAESLLDMGATFTGGEKGMFVPFSGEKTENESCRRMRCDGED